MTIGKTAKNECAKLTATFLNNLAAGAVAAAGALSVYKWVGMSTPEFFEMLRKLSLLEILDYSAGVIGLLLLAGFLHFWGRRILSELTD